MASGRDRRLDALEGRLESLGAVIAQHRAASGFERFAAYADDPVGFIRRELHGSPWARQEDIARLVGANRYVVVRSCNGAGKDWAAARLALWWVYARRGFVLLTGPTERQVKEVLMGEVKRAFAHARRLPGTLYELALRVDATEQAGILAFTSNDVSRMSGFHAPRLMVIITEAQGVEPPAWEGLLSNATGEESRVLAVGNPLQPIGRFFEVSRSAGWQSVKLTAREHPNIIAGREVIAGSITREFIELIKQEYGEGSGVYMARVLGEFPDADDDALAKRAWLELAARKWEEKTLEDRAAAADIVLALDPARFGSDQTCLAVGQGPIVRELITWGQADGMATAGRVLEALDRLGLSRRSTRVIIDEPGLGGPIIDRLREQGVPVAAFNGARTATKPQKFANRRAEAFWSVRRKLEDGQLALPRDPKLWDELTALRWKVDSAGRIALELKDKLRERIGRSPDRADAVALLVGHGAGGKFRFGSYSVGWGGVEVTPDPDPGAWMFR